ncbi:BPSS1780 family membrane protein [Diaphorobacter ruginosibacter]|uniref:BPSS1780 family membrane protein n=1 Tax=Diaphorobacter ruginosibacter TaxID=1715720 RepID=UPI00334090CD
MKLHIVPARTGVDWVRQGIQVFWRQPLALTLLFFTTTAAMSLVSVIPLVGPIVALAMLPAATLIMMEAAAETSLGRVPSPALILNALRAGRQRLAALAALGGIYAVLFLLIIAVASLVDGGQFASAYLGNAPITQDMAQSTGFIGATWVVMALYVPLSMLFWHAPGLVHWHHVPPVKALFFSIVACLKNIGAFSLYGIVWFGVFLGAGLVISLLISLLAMAGLGSAVVAALMIATALVLASMFFTSIVFTFRDNFEPPQRPPEHHPEVLES